MIDFPELRFAALAPAGFVAIGACVVLLGEVFLSRSATMRSRPAPASAIGIVLAMVSVGFLVLATATAGQAFYFGGAEVFNLDHPMLRLDRVSNFAIVLVSVASALVCLVSVSYLDELRINHGEYYALLMIATSGMILMVSSIDMMMVFLGLEVMSIPVYVLAGFDRRKLRSNEAARKYFVIGAFASAILLYGMALLYGATGATQFAGIREAFDPENTLAAVGLALVIVGFAFKIASVPFHQWTPDVYEGAPTSVTAYMAVTVKTAAFVTLLRIVSEAFGGGDEALRSVLWVLAALTMVVGNVMAVIQDNVKRMLAYSSVAHAGYLLVGFVAGSQEGYAAVLFYLLVYVFMNLGAFTVMMALAHRAKDAERFDDFAGLYQSRPVLAGLMTLFMLALAGIPGTGGFFAKFWIFKSAVDAGQVPLAIIGVMASLVSVYYYLRLPVVMFMREPGDESRRLETSSPEWLTLLACTLVVLFLGFFPNDGPGFLAPITVLDWARDSVALLR